MRTILAYVTLPLVCALTLMVDLGCGSSDSAHTGGAPERPDPAPLSDTAIGRLSAGTPAAESAAAWNALQAAGINAFPMLIANFDNRAIAADEFQQATSEPTTVGDACFDLLQQKVEGRWPKSVRDYRVLSPENAGDWLAMRRGKSLDELRRDARYEAVQKAETALAADPPNESVQRGPRMA
jgi:hypothetical protein